MKKILCILVTITTVLQLSAQKVFNIRTYGAKGDGITNDAVAIQKAIDACTIAGGGRVLVPAPFTFIAGPFNLKSNIDFHVEGGAMVKASANEKLYTKSAFRTNPGEGSIWIGADRYRYDGKTLTELKIYRTSPSAAVEKLMETALHSWAMNWKILMC